VAYQTYPDGLIFEPVVLTPKRGTRWPASLDQQFAAGMEGDLERLKRLEHGRLKRLAEVEREPGLGIALERLDKREEEGVFLEAAPSRSAPLLWDRLRLGGPQVIPIDHHYRPADQDLQAFIRANAAKCRFILALMALDFVLTDGPQLVGAKVAVTLEDDEVRPAGSPQPQPQTIAYSVLPLAAGSPYQLNRGYELNADAKFEGFGVGGKRATGTVEHGDRKFVIGSGELTDHPSWTFRPTPTQKLEGETRLSLVIQIPRQRTGSMSVDLSATVVVGRFPKRRVPLQDASHVRAMPTSF
jgi:hypothetical protein